MKTLPRKHKNILSLLALIILAAMIYLPFYLNENNQSSLKNTVFNAIPNDAALIFEFNNYQKLKNDLSGKQYTQDLAPLFFAKNIAADVKLFDKLFFESDSNRRFVQEGRMIAAAQIVEMQQTGFLFVITNENLNVDLSKLQQTWTKNAWQYKAFVSEGQTVHEFKFNDTERVSLCLTSDFLLISQHTVLIERAILQLQQPSSSIAKQSNFRKINEKMGNNADFSIFLNFETLPLYLSQFAAANRNNDLEQLPTLGSWCGLNISLLATEFKIDGYFRPNSKNPFFRALAKESLTNSDFLTGNFPDNTALSLNLSSSDFEIFLKKKGSKLNFFKTYFLPWLGENVAYVITEPTSPDFKKQQFLVFSVADYEKATASMRRLSDDFGGLPTIEYLPRRFEGVVHENIAEALFGSTFAPVRNPYFAFFNKKYLVFANDAEALKSWAEQADFEQTLAETMDYQHLTATMPKSNNLQAYLNFANCYHILAAFTAPNLEAELKKNFEALSKIKPISLQLTPYDDLLVINLKANYDAKGKQPTSVVWRSELLRPASMPPKVVKNHNNGESEILVQDTDNTLYLLNRNGEKIWTRPLSQRIMSGITQIDFYKNQKLQYLFNTETQIHLIDRNGENVEGYPKTLPAKATSGLTVIDYDGKQDYRLFIACENGNIYGFLKDGTPLQGWSPRSKVGLVRRGVKHFIVNGKDFLVVVNEKGIVHTFERNGDRRNSVNLGLLGRPLAASLFVDTVSQAVITGDDRGRIYVSTFGGKSFKLGFKLSKEISNVSYPRLQVANLIGDARKDFLLLNGTELQLAYFNKKNKFTLRYKKELPALQDELFILETETGDKYIATVDFSNHQIFLMNRKGEILRDFPLGGDSRFEITDLFKDGKMILTVANDKWIYAYRLSHLK